MQAFFNLWKFTMENADCDTITPNFWKSTIVKKVNKGKCNKLSLNKNLQGVHKVLIQFQKIFMKSILNIS